MPRRKAAFVRIDTTELEKLARNLQRAKVDMSRDFTRAIRAGGELVVQYARQGARSIPSRRIPRTIQLRDFRGRIGAYNGQGVAITVGGPSAPHARVFEPADGRTSIAHPVFARGNRRKWTWVNQRTHPYARPALARARAKIEAMAMDAAVTSLRRNLGD